MQCKAAVVSYCTFCVAFRVDSFCSIGGPYAFQLGHGAVTDAREMS